MSERDHTLESEPAGKSNLTSIQWQWLPLLLVISAIWFYGLWSLAIKVI